MQAYNIVEDGTLAEIKLTKDELKPDRVIIVVDDNNERIYIWQGSTANVRKKFIASRQALNIRARKGMNYRVHPVTQGDESIEFLQLIEGKAIAKPSIPKPKVEKKVEERRATLSLPKPVTPSVPSIKEPPSLPKPVTKVQTVPSRAIESVPRAEPSVAVQKQIAPPPPAYPVAEPKKISDVSSVLKSLDNVDVPTGFRREMVIVGDTLFTITEKRKKFFGETSIERTIEPISSPPDGEFYVEDYKIRVIIRNHKVYAIEFLRPESPEVILEEIEPAAKKHLSELIDVFEELKKKKK
ncbi:MAG: hypothetical protein ACTSSP_01015 [Candidatus Asgardarchaeia archaeon]